MLLCKTNKFWSIRNNWNMANWKFRKSSNVYFSNHTDATQTTTNRHIKVPSLEYNFRADPKTLVSQNEVQKYLSFRSNIIEDLTEPIEDMPEVIERFKKVLEYCFPERMKATGLILLSAYKMFETAENLTPSNVRLATILSWCIELLHCSYEVSDDILDATVMRNAVPSWYKVEGVGNQAINDSFMILHGPYILLNKYFSEHHCYLPCIKWIHETSMKTFVGQSLDNMNNGKPDLTTFTRNKLRCLVDYKGSYAQYLQPITLAMYLAKIYNVDQNKHYLQSMCELGQYFATQNDILDCYGDTSKTGQIGYDIQGGKFTWLVVTALEQATDTQRQVLKEHYGVHDTESELMVKNLYKELGILDLFLKYEEDSYHKMHKLIGQLPKALSKEFFRKLVDSIYRRQDVKAL